MASADECQHEVPPYPSSPVVRTLREHGPFAGMNDPELQRIVPCIHCGAPLDRGRYAGMISIPDLWDENTWPYGRCDEWR